jgi:hypothetical protein
MLTELERLSRLIYTDKDLELRRFFYDHGITNYLIQSIRKNDRAAFFHHQGINYILIAGSDDFLDWVENLIVWPSRKDLYIKKGVAKSSRVIINEYRLWCMENNISASTKTIIDGHSRGADHVEAITALMNNSRYNYHNKGWAWGLTGAGGRKFKKRNKCDNLTAFVIKGDFAKWINPINRCIGKVVELLRQIKGFRERFKGFKFNLNHQKYDCIKDIEPWNKMDALGNIVE